ncbi:MAG: amino acid permease [Deferribacteraceae bacterium]|jgi:amino acid transporter/mannitol/fructose-specific phosphotransferase system IIA component (Ntr-type)|nr:amino acid permease [Deferribacteraceae bacterium]
MSKLEKGLKLIDIYSIAIGSMVSSGVFLLPGIAYGMCGTTVSIAYLFAGLMSIPGVLSISELVTAMPKAGGGYFFVTRSLGAGVGTVAGILSWFSLIFKATFALIGLSVYSEIIFSLNPKLIAILICLVFLIINYLGVSKAGKAQSVLVLLLFAILSYFFLSSAGKIDFGNYSTFIKDFDISRILSASGFVFVSYGGLLKVASLAEETRDSRMIPKGLIGALLTVSVLYTLIVFVTVGVLPGENLFNSLTPISDAASASMGVKGKVLLSIAAIIAFTSAANVGIMSASRYPYALSRDNMFPKTFQKLSAKYKTPFVSIIVTGLIVISGLFLNLNLLVEVASTSLILTYILANFSVIVMRESRLTNYKPQFRAPMYPYLQIAGIVFYLFLIYEIGLEAIIATVVFMIISFFVYILYGRAKNNQEYALLHVIERILNKELTGIRLEKELRNILKERDSIKEDRFDKLVKKALVFDFESRMTYEELYKEISEKLGQRIGLSGDEVYNLLCDKEKRYSSVLGDNIAIPHVIVEGEKIFDVVIVRNKEGVVFEENKKINVIFVLIGSRDERNFHLKALSAIAQVVNGKDFYKKWMEAKNPQVLKDIVMLSKRQR